MTTIRIKDDLSKTEKFCSVTSAMLEARGNTYNSSDSIIEFGTLDRIFDKFNYVTVKPNKEPFFAVWMFHADDVDVINEGSPTITPYVTTDEWMDRHPQLISNIHATLKYTLRGSPEDINIATRMLAIQFRQEFEK